MIHHIFIGKYDYDRKIYEYEEDTYLNSDVQDFNTYSNVTKDFSTTNIQVENIDEADIIKTDGNYIYSISYNNVIITDVNDPTNLKLVATIKSSNNVIPKDLILNNNKLIVINERISNSSILRNNYSNTVVKIYDITNKEKPYVEKSYELYEPYYTSRCINNTLYVISSGNLRKENNKVDRFYVEDNMSKELPLKNIKYLDNVSANKQTLISSVDLDNISSDIKLNSYLIDISNAYISENSLYLLNNSSNRKNYPTISSIFGLKGIFGAFEEYENYDYSSTTYTQIYKFDILNEGNIKFKADTKIKGKTINQYSLDEQNNNLRIALTDSEGSRIAIFDNNLKEISVSGNIAKGEKMYSTRFIGNKAYMVTYRTMDPLWVIDLSNEKNIKVLGELDIPGYSTYLHPYDENHLIGIGMQSEEIVSKSYSGKTTTSSKITGMKMALFDISNVKNPIQISEAIIGDSKTTSAILTNPKALLFSKEKNLIAIPVNNYPNDFVVTTTDDSNSAAITAYKNYNNSYISEGYYVYNINVDNGFTLKGIITHDMEDTTSYKNYTNSLRGMYIDNNLYTISENMIKVNNLDSLDLITELKLK